MPLLGCIPVYCNVQYYFDLLNKLILIYVIEITEMSKANQSDVAQMGSALHLVEARILSTDVNILNCQ